jgi:hypothetical protein
MSRAKALFALFLVFLLVGCESTYSEKTVTTSPAPILKSTTRIYVGIPFDASFKNKVAEGSGRKTADALYTAFVRYSRLVSMGKLPEGFSEALESARKHNAEYLVYPNIIHWEDRATEWSGIRDKLDVKIDLIETSSGQVAFSREVTGTGKWMTDGGDTPSDMLPAPCDEYVNALFRRIEKPSAL